MPASKKLFHTTRLPPLTWWESYSIISKFCRFWCAWERNHVTYVLHTSNKQYQSFKSQSEATVWTSAEATCIKIPPHIFHRYVTLVYFVHQFIVILFTNGTTDNFSNLRKQDICSLNCLFNLLAVYLWNLLVNLHEESLNLLWI